MNRTRLALFVLLFASYAWFYQAGGWNQNSRFDLTRAIMNEHSFRIDPYERSTGDKAMAGGHFYSDKAPGLAFAAVPAMAVARPIMRIFGADPESYPGIAFLSWLATVTTCGLFTALAGVALFSLARDLGATRGAAIFAATAYGLSTPIWTLATIFIGHAFAAALLVFAFAAAVRIGERPGAGRWALGAGSTEALAIEDLWLGLAVGLCAGWATVSEFPSAVPAALIALLAAINAWPLGRRRMLAVVGSVAAGALACVAVLMVYQWACFGSPFHVAYSSELQFEGMRQGWFGINAPKMLRLRRILTSEYRGILPLAPLLAIAPAGLILLARHGARHARAAIVAALIAVFYLMLNSGYSYWDGGWSYGPRHLSPAIPFVCLGLAWVWMIGGSKRPATQARVVGRLGRTVLVALWIWGAGLSLIAVSVMAQPPEAFRRPVAQLLWPAFVEGDLALNQQDFTMGGVTPEALRAHDDAKAAWNVGMKLRLHGKASLLPLAMIWAICAWMLVSDDEARRTASRSRSAP